MLFESDTNSAEYGLATCSRRRFLQTSLGLASALLLPGAYASQSSRPAAQSAVSQAERMLSFVNLHTGEHLNAAYWAEGHYQASELKAINHILRDHRTGDVAQMDNALLDLLYVLHQKVDSNKPFQIISGYRSPETNAALRKKSSGVAKKSQHMLGKAVDIRLPDTQLSNLRKAALDCQAGGVGYYPRSNFVHVDSGPVRHWG